MKEELASFLILITTTNNCKKNKPHFYPIYAFFLFYMRTRKRDTSSLHNGVFYLGMITIGDLLCLFSLG